MFISKEEIYKNLNFCPVEITLQDGTKVLCSRSWNWWKATYPDIQLPVLTENDKILQAWDLNKEKFVSIEIADIEETSLSDYKGQRYLE